MTGFESTPEYSAGPPDVVKAQWLERWHLDGTYRVTASTRTALGAVVIGPDDRNSGTVNLAKYAQDGILSDEPYFYSPGDGDGLVLFQSPNGIVQSIIKSRGGKRPQMTELSVVSKNEQSVIIGESAVDIYKKFNLDPGMRVVVFVRQKVVNGARHSNRQRVAFTQHGSELRPLYNHTIAFLERQGYGIKPPKKTITDRIFDWLVSGLRE